MRREFGRPFPDDWFPLAAKGVTDNFNRTDEFPITTPWDTSHHPSDAAQLFNQRFYTVFRGSWYDGGAVYAPSGVGQIVPNFEATITIGTDLSTRTNGEAGLYFKTRNWADLQYSIAARGASSVVMNYALSTQITYATTVSVGDRIGLRARGGSASGWHLPVGTSTWVKVGVVPSNLPSTAAQPGDLEVYLYADDGSVFIDDFYYAQIGQLITPRGRTRARRTAW